MKRLLVSSIAFVLLSSFVGSLAPHAFAQGTGQVQAVPVDTTPIQGSNTLQADIPTISQNGTTGSAGTQTFTVGSNGDITPGAVAPSSAATANAANNTPTSPNLPTGDSSAYSYIMTQIMDLFAWLMGVSVITLDYAAYYTVIQMGSIVGGVNGLSAIGVGWRILRDLGNIILIFGFLAIGISIILDLDIYGYGTKTLPMLLIAAVFLNFSLFISEAVIDVGNLFATEIYTQINDGQVPTPAQLSGAGSTGFLASVKDEGISNKIMAQLGLQQIYGAAVDPNNTSFFKSSTPWYIGFMGILLFLVAAFVMFSLAFILISRFVILVLLIIAAPIGFAGLAVPKLKGTAQQWWSYLIEQVAVAPVLFLMLYVALAVITDARFLTSFNGSGATLSWTNYLNGDFSGLAPLVLSFLVAMGLLLGVTILAKRMSAFGAGWATKTAGFATVGVTAMTAGFVGRRTVGRGANALSRRFRSSKFGQTDLGRLAVGVTDYGAKSTFDLRNAKTVSKGLGAAGVNAGTGSKTSYKKILDDSVKARVDYAKSLKAREKTPQQIAQEEAAATEVADATAARDADKQALAGLEEKRSKLGYIDPVLERDIEEAQRKLSDSEAAHADALDSQTKLAEEIGKTSWTVQQAQAKYAESLEKASGFLKPGTYANATGFGAAVGAAHGIPVAVVAGAGAGLATTGVVGVAGLGAYLASAAPQANKEALGLIKGLAKKDKNKKALEDAFKEVLKDEEAGKDKGKEVGGDAKKEAA